MFELILCENTLLSEIADSKLTKGDVARTYALSLNSREGIDWRKVNQAIIDRWGRSGLVWIKNRAWKSKD